MTEPPSGAAAPPPAPSRRFKALLALSLALNLLILGAVIGGLWHGRHGHRGFSRGGDEISLLSFSRELTPERGQELRKWLRGQRRDLAPYWNDIRQARADAAKALTADPFDSAGLKAAFNRIDEAETRLKAAAREIVMQAAERLTPEERKQLSDWWQARKSHLFRAGERWRKPSKEGGKPSAKDDAPAASTPSATPNSPAPSDAASEPAGGAPPTP